MGEYDYDHVSQFPSNKMIFDTYINTQDSIQDYYCERITWVDKINRTKYEKICKYFVKSLIYIHNNSVAEAHDSFLDITEELCEYINYWLNYELRNIIRCPYNALTFYHDIKQNNYGVPQLEKCKKNIKNFDDTTFINIEILYKLYYNLDKYLNSFTDDKLEQCNYANECSKLYDEKKTQCNSNSRSFFCKELIVFKDLYNISVAKEDTCPDLKKVLLSPRTDSSDLGSQKLEESHAPLGGTFVDRGNELKDYVPSGSFSLGFNIIISISIFFFISFLLFIFYKFTSFGSLLCLRTRHKKTFFDDIYEERQQMQLDESENKQADMNNKEYYMLHNSISTS
ncbi:PIR Superfamily Protein [Plasmodium ovale wallikeri]|uniref:PIR Superfamily Protein n=2 Tax=Plasmodium ovale TaxID=36330 RepID=A0A1A9ARM8_PLAOA|nr:PIR Superfamily Protein [Plasmodium ovale wallikeri]SBT58902.1 PIR Superfamily Protein [Plasmodium ovale wallikeri]SBT73351.1 PIR protein [Plasmodium ovale]